MEYRCLNKYLMYSAFIGLSFIVPHHLYAMKVNNEDLEASPQRSVSLPQINIDNFDEETMAHILKTYGSFEVVGPSVDALSQDAIEALEESKKVLNLPLTSLEKVYHNLPLTSGKKINFHGFQNVHKETSEKFKQGTGQVRNQVAYHFKPYLAKTDPRIPEGIEDLKAYSKYYNNATTFLHRLYDTIGDSFIDSQQKTVFREDAETSVLSSRKYFPGKEGETGIPAHSDYGLLTMVVSDKDGLEVLEGENSRVGKWIRATYGEASKPRFYINVGDWLLFQTGKSDKFVAGVHRVPEVQGDRYSLATFLNPPLDQRLPMFKDGKVTYGDFLFAPDKKVYLTNHRLD